MIILPLPVPSPVAPATITIDVSRQTPISPYVYGVNNVEGWKPEWRSEWRAKGLFPFARQGGNRMTAYNWETNASNAGNDYFHENDGYLGESDEPGWTVNRFLKVAQEAGAAALVTVPTQGHVSADKIAEMNGSKDVGQTPDYLNVRFLRSYASKPGGALAFPPDTGDRAVYQDEFVSWVQKAKSPRTPVWFSLDNEPDLWASTHARIETAPTSYARIIGNNAEFAAMIKRVAPNALVFGPVNYGWQGMARFQSATDANGRFFVDAYLDAMREAGAKAGRRLIDVYDFHWYPEATGDGTRITFTDKPETPAVAAARIQAPRSLWDSTYVEKSWIADTLGGKPIRLLPLMKEKVAALYPGTKLAVTEYDFGGRRTVSGMLAQADVLGIFGRYGLFAANHWGFDPGEAPAYAAFRAFTDFDRKGARFGDRALGVAGESPAENSVYAALDAKNPKRLTLVIVNKTAAPQPMRLAIRGFRTKSARAFVVAGDAYDPAKCPVAMSGDAPTLTAPAMSVVSAELLRR